MSDHDTLRDDAAAWVLGALDDDEAWRFTAHLEVCQACRDEVDRLRVAADVLPLAAPPVEPPPELKARLMATVEAEARERREPEAERPRRRWLGLVTARPATATAFACLLLVAGGVAGFALRGGDDVTRTPFQGGAQAELVREDGQATIQVQRLAPPPEGRVYQVWIKRPGRDPEPDTVFTVDRAGRAGVLVRGDVEGAEAVLVTDEPRGGSRAPTRRPLLTAPLA
jgi:anti-sigma-K factor RskA